MGSETTKLTKEELIRAFKEKFDSIEENEKTIPSIVLFHKLVKESKILKVRAYFGEGENVERLHSKAYLFLRNTETTNLLDRYKAGVIGSSNLTPSGLVGNTELNVIITDPEDLKYLETWFDKLWEVGTEEFQKLRVTNAILEGIEKSKFGKHLTELFVYVTPEEFFKILIKFMNADYLFEDWKESKLLRFQQIDAIRCLRLFNERNYRGVFLTSSVGLGKSYVACQVAKYFLRNNKKVLLIAPSGLIQNEEQWPRYLKEFRLMGKVDLLPMGMIQRNPEKFERWELPKYDENYGLIIVDEAHNYRNEDAYRTRNVKKIIDVNGNANILFLTATPINTSLEDLLNLIRLFYRKGQNLFFDKLYRDLEDIVKIFFDKSYEELTDAEKQELAARQEEVERELFVKSTRETIKTSKEYLKEIELFSGVDIRKIPDPSVREVVYSLDDKYRNIVNGIVDFISNLTAAHLRVVDPEKGARLGGFFKWILYKRFESDITSYYLTLKRLLRKGELIKDAIAKKDPGILQQDEHEDDVNVNFGIDYREKIAEVIDKIKQGKGDEHVEVLSDLEKDIELIRHEVMELEAFLHHENKLLFTDDKKLETLFKIINRNKQAKFLVFTEYKDTLQAVKEYCNNKIEHESIRFVESNTKNKQGIIEKFNSKNDKLRILVTTDTLAEGYNISGADIVINFDIPYNPVRLIQRIGRATRLDYPKKIKVQNFRPDENIDRELELVDRLKLRIEDIIRFVGVEYRIWFEREKMLLKERRRRDVRIYRMVAKEILDSVRKDLWSGSFGRLEVPIAYTKPALILMQRAINKYGITKSQIEKLKIPQNNIYTLLKGKEHLTLFYNDSKSFNEDKIIFDIKEYKSKIKFETVFQEELNEFDKQRQQEKVEQVVISYYTDTVDRMINSIVDIFQAKHYSQILKRANDFITVLSSVKDKCGSNTEKILREIHSTIKKGNIGEGMVRSFIEQLEGSFTKKYIQQKLPVDDKPVLAIGFLGE